MEKVKYKCKGCGWSKELPSTWADVKPRFCPTPTCEMSVKKSKGRKSFKTNPDMLETTFYTPVEPERKDVTVTTIDFEADSAEAKEDLSSGKEKRSRYAK